MSLASCAHATLHTQVCTQAFFYPERDTLVLQRQDCIDIILMIEMSLSSSSQSSLYISLHNVTVGGNKTRKRERERRHLKKGG